MENHEVPTSPQVFARIGGVLYLIMIVVGRLFTSNVRPTGEMS
jgi:hypothetical protein